MGHDSYCLLGMCHSFYPRCDFYLYVCQENRDESCDNLAVEFGLLLVDLHQKAKRPNVAKIRQPTLTRLTGAQQFCTVRTSTNMALKLGAVPTSLSSFAALKHQSAVLTS